MGLDFNLEYNYWVNKLKKADNYFSDKSIDDNKKVQPKILEAFNNIIKNLSRMQKEYKRVIGEEMENNNKFNGFKC